MDSHFGTCVTVFENSVLDTVLGLHRVFIHLFLLFCTKSYLELQLHMYDFNRYSQSLNHTDTHTRGKGIFGVLIVSVSIEVEGK